MKRCGNDLGKMVNDERQSIVQIIGNGDVVVTAVGTGAEALKALVAEHFDCLVREKCIQAGANDYLSKPVDSDQLLALLRVWLYR